MDFFELEAFYILSQNLHFARTADKIHLSPSALSRLISRLEAETGVTLLDRGTRQVRLTEEGRHFARFARESIHQKASLLSGFAVSDEAVAGTLRVYASVTACYSILPSFIEKISEKYPKIILSVETGDPAGAPDALKEHRCDIAVSAIPETGRDGMDAALSSMPVFSSLDCVKIQTTPLVFTAKKGSRFDSLRQEEVYTKAHFILPKMGLARKRFDRKIKDLSVKPLIAAETAGNEAVLALSALGLGIGLVPRIVLESGPFSQGLMQYPESFCGLGSYSIGFIMRPHTSGTNRLMQIASEIVHSLAV